METMQVRVRALCIHRSHAHVFILFSGISDSEPNVPIPPDAVYSPTIDPIPAQPEPSPRRRRRRQKTPPSLSVKSWLDAHEAMAAANNLPDDDGETHQRQPSRQQTERLHYDYLDGAELPSSIQGIQASSSNRGLPFLSSSGVWNIQVPLEFPPQSQPAEIPPPSPPAILPQSQSEIPPQSPLEPRSVTHGQGSLQAETPAPPVPAASRRPGGNPLIEYAIRKKNASLRRKNGRKPSDVSQIIPAH